MHVNTGARKIMLTLEGNIGAGKSTFLRIIQKYLPQIDVVFEPTNKWQGAGDSENLLKFFYDDSKRWAYTFQSYAFISRIQEQEESLARNAHLPVQILERSVYCDRYCFAFNAYEMGMMTPLEWHIYTEWFSWLVENHTSKPDGFIYLRTNPETCISRIAKRNRSEESTIAPEYLAAIHQKHEDWLINRTNSCAITASIPVLELVCDKEFEHNIIQQQEHMQKIETFISKLMSQQHNKITTLATESLPSFSTHGN